MRVQSIQVKVTALILLVLVFGISFSISFALSNQRENLIDAAQQTLAVNTRVLNLNIRNLMLNGEAPLANRTMADLREMPEFLEYEIYRRDGSRAFSDYETLDFVNSFQDNIRFSETPRLEGGMLSNPGFMQVLRFSAPHVQLDEVAQEMEYYFPILNNSPDCRVCHGTDHFIRGVAHFRISLGDVYAKVASARRFLTYFFLAVGLFIFAAILVLMRRVVIRPVLNIGNVVSRVGEGDLETQVELKQRDELGDLAQRINRMILGLKASKQLELENTRIEARLEESRKYLDNIKEGLLLLNPDGTISEEYSTFLLELFEKDSISGIPFSRFIFGDEMTDEQKQEMDMFLDILFNNQTASMMMILDINPINRLEKTLPSGRRIIVSSGFQRIGEGGNVENVMVLFQDITDIEETRAELEKEREIRESELEQIAAILKLGPQVFEDFIQSSDQVLEFITANRKDLFKKDILDQAFRDTHSLKGTARYLKFTRMEQTAHRLEDHFDQFREQGGSLAQIDSPVLEDLLQQLKDSLRSVEGIINRFRQFSLGQGESNGKKPEWELFRLRLTEMVEELSGELEKEVAFQLHSDWDNPPGIQKLQPSLFHLIRNALDHGLEDSYERIAAGKPEKAKLNLSFLKEGENTLKIEVEDDGRGLDFEALEQRAMDTGLLRPGKHFPSQILKTLFMPGFSSRDSVSALSGRGVGLDAVKADIQALKGKINVRTAKGKGSAFILSIPLSSLEVRK